MSIVHCRLRACGGYPLPDTLLVSFSVVVGCSSSCNGAVERKHDQTILVRVRWNRFSSAWDSWEELSSIIDRATTAVLEFLDTRSDTPLASRVLALGKIRAWWA